MTARGAEIRQAQARMKAVLEPCWAMTRGTLEGHDADRHARAIATLDAFADALVALPPRPAPARPARAAVETAVARLLDRLQALNAETGGCLLETDEREIIVPFVIEAAAPCGCPPETYEHGDITLPARRF
ncbi:MAG: hypothetical protein AAFZ09_06425 [Pseudomonadota bacterium]